MKTLVSLGMALASVLSIPPISTALASSFVTVYIQEGVTRTPLHLQPGFATVIQADHRIDTVAIGDPHLVSATTVHRGTEVFDLVLQAQAETGLTNMIIWFGELATVWSLDIGPGPRTADIVHVVTSGRPLTSSASKSAGEHTQTRDSEQVPTPRQIGLGRSPAPTVDTSVKSGEATGSDNRNDIQRGSGSALMEVHQQIQQVSAVFTLTHVRAGVLIHYQITNGGRVDLLFRPGSVFVRINGHATPYGMARDSADRGRPDVIPPGSTEVGSVTAIDPNPRTVQLVLSLFPAIPREEALGVVPPVTFQPVFSGVGSLSVTDTP